MVEEAITSGGLSAAELDFMRSVEDSHWWYRALRRHVVDSIHPPTPEFSLLDAGCGSGGMLGWMRERFPQASLTGLDLNQHALRLTEERTTGARLVHGSVDRMPLDEAEFDFVTALDVLYHRDVDDGAALREIHRVLRPGGTLIVNVAAFEFLRGSHDVATNTARRYTRPKLGKLLKDSGFTVETLTYWNMILLPAVALVRWLSRGQAHRPDVRSDLSLPAPALNIILQWIAQSELACSRRIALPFGTSLFAIARK